ncbi:MAG TPA: hypothetical protein VGW40_02800 [Allosphingosinicella sp.]|nr:hypothetical protein [Allosphingosinicella sp.]
MTSRTNPPTPQKRSFLPDQLRQSRLDAFRHPVFNKGHRPLTEGNEAVGVSERSQKDERPKAGSNRFKERGHFHGLQFSFLTTLPAHWANRRRHVTAVIITTGNQMLFEIPKRWRF